MPKYPSFISIPGHQRRPLMAGAILVTLVLVAVVTEAFLSTSPASASAPSIGGFSCVISHGACTVRPGFADAPTEVTVTAWTPDSGLTTQVPVSATVSGTGFVIHVSPTGAAPLEGQRIHGSYVASFDCSSGGQPACPRTDGTASANPDAAAAMANPPIGVIAGQLAAGQPTSAPPAVTTAVAAGGQAPAVTSPLAATGALDTRGTLSGLPWLSGVWADNSLSESEGFGTWRGRPLDLIQAYVARDQGWPGIVQPTWPVDSLAAFPGKLELSVPPYPRGGGSLAGCAGGAYDEQWRRFGSFLVAHHRPDTIVRLGWEFNGNWFYWQSDRGGIEFKGCFQKVAAAIRSTDPAALMDWTFTAHNSQALASNNPFDAYPGDGSVDFIGIDDYDMFPASRGEAAFDAQCQGSNGLCNAITFTRAHGKKLGVGEWGVASCNSGGGGDNAFYISKMFNTFMANRDVLGYESYFDDPAPGNVCSSIVNGTQNPKAAAEYRTLFGPSSPAAGAAGAAPIAPAPATSPAPAATPAPATTPAPAATPAPTATTMTTGAAVPTTGAAPTGAAATSAPPDAAAPTLPAATDSPPATDSAAPPGGSTAKLLWSDEFNGPAGSAPDADNWRAVNGAPQHTGESECYTSQPDNVALDGHGDLVLTARHEASCGGMPFSSGRVESAGLRTFRYGYLETRAKLPTGTGAFGSFWLLGANLPQVGWPRSGETDIAQVRSDQPDAVRTNIGGVDPAGKTWLSGWDAPGGTHDTGADLGAAFHTYGVDWAPDSLTFYLDGKPINKIEKSQVPVWLWNQDNYLILSLAMVNPGGNTATQSMVVDYVRAYSSNPHTGAGAAPSTGPTTPVASSPAPVGAAGPAPGGASAARPADIPGQWKVAFDDEFDGSSLDRSKWQMCNPSFRASCVPWNNELEIFNTATEGNPNVQVSDGALHLITTKDAGGQIHSGMVSSGPWPASFGPRPAGYTGFSYTYGYYEGRVKVPKGNGFWPSLWELPEQQQQGGKGWPDTGEYDNFEIPGNNPTDYHFTAHWGGGGGNCGHPCSDQDATIPDASAGWHTFGLDWEPTGLTWYVDGQKMGHTVTTAAAIKNYPFYLIANLSVGGDWPPLGGGVDGTTPFPSSLDIDWLRVYQHA